MAINRVTEGSGGGVVWGSRWDKKNEFHFGPARFEMAFGHLSEEGKEAFECGA